MTGLSRRRPPLDRHGEHRGHGGAEAEDPSMTFAWAAAHCCSVARFSPGDSFVETDSATVSAPKAKRSGRRRSVERPVPDLAESRRLLGRSAAPDHERRDRHGDDQGDGEGEAAMGAPSPTTTTRWPRLRRLRGHDGAQVEVLKRVDIVDGPSQRSPLRQPDSAAAHSRVRRS